MIKFEKYYDGIQTHIQAISTKETKNNGNIDCCYTIGKYIKEEIEDLQNELQQKENIIKEAIKYNEQLLKIYDCGVEKDNAETNILILKGALEILDKGE